MRIEVSLEDRHLLDEYILLDPWIIQTANWVIEYASEKFREIDTLHDEDGKDLSPLIKDKIKAMMWQKAIHTWDVVVAMWDISQEKYSVNLLGALLELAFTHDVARFPQALLKTFNDAKTFDHGNTGRDLFNQFLADNNLVDKQLAHEIAEGIGLHNDKTIPKGAHLLTKRIRDADKLAIFRRAEMYVKPSYDHLPTKERLFTPSAYNSFMAERPISPTTLKTEADLILFRLAWIFDLNTQETRVRIVQEGHLQFMLDALKKLVQGQNPLFADVDKKIYLWMRQHNLIHELSR